MPSIYYNKISLLTRIIPPLFTFLIFFQVMKKNEEDDDENIEQKVRSLINIYVIVLSHLLFQCDSCPQ